MRTSTPTKSSMHLDKMAARCKSKPRLGQARQGGHKQHRRASASEFFSENVSSRLGLETTPYQRSRTYSNFCTLSLCVHFVFQFTQTCLEVSAKCIVFWQFEFSIVIVKPVKRQLDSSRLLVNSLGTCPTLRSCATSTASIAQCSQGCVKKVDCSTYPRVSISKR